MGNNWKITDTLTKVFAEEVPDGQGSIRLSMLHRETVSCVIAYFGAADWGRYWKVSVKAPEKIETRLRRVELVPSAYPCHKEQDDNYLRIVPGMYPDLLRDLDTEDDGADKKYLTKRSARTVAQPVVGCDGRCGACRWGLCYCDRNGN